MYELLATPLWRDQVDWSRTDVFWGDERMVPPDDAKSNYRMARETLLAHVPVPAGNVHRVMTESGVPVSVARHYERTIREVFGIESPAVPEFDLILLGVGENGHTASLFPYSKTLHERERLVAEDYVEEVGGYRITMTVPLLNAGRTIMFLVSGEAKAEVVRDVISGPRNVEKLPAQLIEPAGGNLVWLLDAPAASRLPASIQRSA